MDNKYLAILIIILMICIGVFLYQYNNNVSTFIIVNATEIPENGSLSGQLLDSYGLGVANKTINYNEKSTLTDENGEFTISVNGKSIDNISFAGDGKYQSCAYENNITVI